MTREGIVRNTLVLLAALIAACLFTASPALAGDVDPTGAKLKGVVEDYLAKAPENDPKARTLRQGQNDCINPTSEEIITILCGAEVLSVIGAVIWSTRKCYDGCGAKVGDMDSFAYCRAYSSRCDHWVWSPDCLKGFDCTSRYGR